MANAESDWENDLDSQLPSPADESGNLVSESNYPTLHFNHLELSETEIKTSPENIAYPLPNCILLQGNIRTIQFGTDKASVLNPANLYLNHNAGVAEALRYRWTLEVAGHTMAMEDSFPLNEGEATKHALYQDAEVAEIVHVSYSPYNQVMNEQEQIEHLSDMLEEIGRASCRERV